MCRGSDLKSFWARLPCCLLKGTVKGRFLDIYLTTFFGVGNLGKTLARSVRFFCNCSKFKLDFKTSEKNRQKEFCFLRNCIGIGSLKLSQLRREYLSSPVNVLTNSLKIFYITKRHLFKLNCLCSDQ